MSHENPANIQEAAAQESVLSTALWTGGVLLIVAIIAFYIAM